MRRVVLGIVLGAVLLSGVGLAAFRRPAAPPALSYPCIDASREGWITVTSSEALLIVEWGPGHGAVRAGPPTEISHTTTLTEAQARLRARALLETPRGALHDSSAGFVSLFVQCDGAGSYWRGNTNVEPPGYRRCLHPRHQTRVECVKEVWDSRSHATPGGTADGLALRLRDEASALGVSVSPGTPTGWLNDDDSDVIVED